MTDKVQNNEENDAQNSPAKIPAKIRNLILSIVGIIGALTLLITKSDDLLDAYVDFKCKWFDCETKYTAFLLDASSDMEKHFITQNEVSKTKWLSLMQSFAQILPAFSQSSYAVRYFGQAKCDLEESSGSIAEFGHKMKEKGIKKEIEGISPSGEASLIRALSKTINDFKEHSDSSFTNQIIIISAGNICDFNKIALDALYNDMEDNGIKVDFQFVALDPDVSALKNINELTEKMGGALQFVDKAESTYAAIDKAITNKKGTDVFEIAKSAYDANEDQNLTKEEFDKNEGLALAYFDLVKDDNSKAVVYKARIFLNKNGIYRDDVKGLELYNKAVNLNDPEAMYRLGKLLKKGRPTTIPADPERAKELISKAAELGYEPAKQYASSN